MRDEPLRFVGSQRQLHGFLKRGNQRIGRGFQERFPPLSPIFLALFMRARNEAGLEFQMDFGKARLLSTSEQVTLVKINHRNALRECEERHNFLRQIHHWSDFISQKAVRWLRIDKAINAFVNGKPPVRLKNTRELLKSLWFVRDIQKHRARCDGVNRLRGNRTEILS